METLDCGHAPTPSGIGTGYATDSAGRKICYACATEIDKARMLTDDIVVAYVSDDEKSIINWPGGILGRVVASWTGNKRYGSRVGFYSRRYVNVVDIHGQKWYGQGPNENGTYVTLRKRKGQ